MHRTVDKKHRTGGKWHEPPATILYNCTGPQTKSTGQEASGISHQQQYSMGLKLGNAHAQQVRFPNISFRTGACQTVKCSPMRYPGFYLPSCAVDELKCKKLAVSKRLKKSVMLRLLIVRARGSYTAVDAVASFLLKLNAPAKIDQTLVADLCLSLSSYPAIGLGWLDWPACLPNTAKVKRRGVLG